MYMHVRIYLNGYACTHTCICTVMVQSCQLLAFIPDLPAFIAVHIHVIEGRQTVGSV